MEAILILIALLLLLVLRVPVAFAMGGLGCFLLWLGDFSLLAVPLRLLSAVESFELLSVPLFVLISNVLLTSGIGQDIFTSFNRWFGRRRGSLGVATMGSCVLFSAISGSSVATAATIGTVAVPEMKKRAYSDSFIVGSLAAGGTLGILIPPSIPLIVYGIITETSITQLFLAGILPGLWLFLLFTLYSLFRHGDRKPVVPIQENNGSSEKKWQTLSKMIPVLLLVIFVLGSIYTGVATPTESAAIGVVFALIYTFITKKLNWCGLTQAAEDTFKTTVMIFSVIAGAKLFSYALTLYQIPQTTALYLTEYISSPTMLIFAIALVLLLIGLFLESLSMLLLMVPVLLPTLQWMNIDLIWFGIFFVILLETALITPPIGLNLFVIRALHPITLRQQLAGVLPFVLMLFLSAILLWFWQDLALYLPTYLR